MNAPVSLFINVFFVRETRAGAHTHTHTKAPLGRRTHPFLQMPPRRRQAPAGVGVRGGSVNTHRRRSAGVARARPRPDGLAAAAASIRAGTFVQGMLAAQCSSEADALALYRAVEGREAGGECK